MVHERTPEENLKWQRTKKARKIQKETGMKYTQALRFVISEEEKEKN